jgi:hypothetical protein
LERFTGSRRPEHPRLSRRAVIRRPRAEQRAPERERDAEGHDAAEQNRCRRRACSGCSGRTGARSRRRSRALRRSAPRRRTIAGSSASAGLGRGSRSRHRRSDESDRRLFGVRAAAFVTRGVDRLPDRHHSGVSAARRCRFECRGRRPGSGPVRCPHVVRGWKVPARSQVVARPGATVGEAYPWSRSQHGQGWPRSSGYRGLTPSSDHPERVATGRDRRVSDVPVGTGFDPPPDSFISYRARVARPQRTWPTGSSGRARARARAHGEAGRTATHRCRR